MDETDRSRAWSWTKPKEEIKAAQPGATDNLGCVETAREDSRFRSSPWRCLSFIVRQGMRKLVAVALSSLSVIVCGCAYRIRVVDESGHPIAHASVQVVRYSIAADPVGQTDGTGAFSLSPVPGVETLDISHADFESFHFAGPGKVPKRIVLKQK